MKSYHFLFIVLFALSSYVGKSQDILYTDSLTKVLNQLSDREKTDHLWLIAREYAFVDSLATQDLMKQLRQQGGNAEQSTAMIMALEGNLHEASGHTAVAKELYKSAAERLDQAGEPLKAGHVFNDLATLHGRSGEYLALRAQARQAIARFSSKDSLALAVAYSNLGRSYQLMGQFDSAIVFLYHSAELLENYVATPLLKIVYLRAIGNTYNNLGIAYMENGNTDKGFEFYQKAAKKKKELDDPVEVGNIFINIGGIMFSKNDLIAARDYLDSASFYYHQEDFTQGLLMCKSNAAAVSNVVKEYEEAIAYATEGIKLSKKTGDKNNLALNYLHLSTAHWYLQNPERSGAFMDSSYQIAREIGSKNIISELQNLQYEFALDRRDFEDALLYRNAYIATRDSMYQVQKSREISELETKYKTMEKEQEIILLNQENALKEATIARNTFLIGGLVVLMMLIIVVFNFIRYRAKQRHEAALREQKMRMRESQMQAVIDSQERERKRFATDLHDGMGQLISVLQLNIQSMSAINGDLDKRDALYENSTRLLNEVHTEIRNIAFNLMPQTLMKEGLVPAIQELIYRINKAGRLHVQLSVFDLDTRINEVAEVSLYRIIQEFLSNIIKYSKASKVFLGLVNHEDELVLSIEDDGEGYDVGKFEESKGNGWRNINTRLNLIKAEIDIDTQEGRRGSSIIINIPSVSLIPAVADRQGISV